MMLPSPDAATMFRWKDRPLSSPLLAFNRQPHCLFLPAPPFWHGTERQLSLVSPADLSASSILQFYIAADLGFSAEISVEPGIFEFSARATGMPAHDWWQLVMITY